MTTPLQSQDEKDTNGQDRNEPNTATLKIKVKIRKKKAIWLLVVFASLLASYYFFSDNAINLYQKYFVNDHKEIVSYLDTLDFYNNDGNEIINNARLKLYRMNPDEYSNHIQKSRENLQQLLDNIAELKTPKGFSQYKQANLAITNQRLLVLTRYDETRKTNHYEALNKSVSELNRKQKEASTLLMKSLEKSSIKYYQVGDGSFRYFYKNHSAKPLN
jgi:hypothetical protein